MVVYRSKIFSPIADPFSLDDVEKSFVYFDDGHLAVEGRQIVSIGTWEERPRSGETVEFEHPTLITPTLIDTHLHAPQLQMIGSYGGHLLEWLNRYTFPTEMRFADPEHARTIAPQLFNELVKNGTGCALLFSTIHTEATDIFFEEAHRRGFRAIIGKTLMDRHAPEALLEDAESAVRGSRELIRKWHRRTPLLNYAVTPRFAPTSTSALLAAAGELKKEFPDLWVHTHVSENVAEVEWVHELFPDSHSYAEVYDRYGLLGEKTVLAHGVHLTDDELELISRRKARISHCPNSNLFLGSGLFPLKKVLSRGVMVGLGSDIGAGTTPSLMNAMADAYKVQQVRGVSLSPFQLWYLSTLGGARVLGLDDTIGSLQRGKDADFLVLDLQATSLLTLRTANAETLSDTLAGLVFIGDDRVVEKTFVAGREIYSRSA
jgi:guanine deaminase